MQRKQVEIDTAEMEINRIKRILEKRDQDVTFLDTQYKMATDRLAGIEDELELKSGENNKLRKQCADLEAALQDLYLARKGQGDHQAEIDSLKHDNDKLLQMLKETVEYADYDDSMLLTAAGRTKTGFNEARETKKKIDNDWIPTEAVRAIIKIKEDFKGMLTETAVS